MLVQLAPGLPLEDDSTRERLGYMGSLRSDSARKRVVPGGLEASRVGVAEVGTCSLASLEGSGRMGFKPNRERTRPNLLLMSLIASTFKPSPKKMTRSTSALTHSRNSIAKLFIASSEQSGEGRRC